MLLRLLFISLAMTQHTRSLLIIIAKHSTLWFAAQHYSIFNFYDAKFIQGYIILLLFYYYNLLKYTLQYLNH